MGIDIEETNLTIFYVIGSLLILGDRKGEVSLKSNNGLTD